MGNGNVRYGWIVMVLAAGCAPAAPVDRPAADAEAAVRAKFAELQAAVKSADADKIWMLLDAKSQADAEKAAKSLQASYAKADADQKAKQEEALGLSGADLAKLTGIGFLKSKRFRKKYDELPDAKIEKVIVQGDNATVHFLEPDGDHEKMILIRHDGQWQVWLAMPKLTPP